MTASDLMRWDEKIWHFDCGVHVWEDFPIGCAFSLERSITGNVLMNLKIFFANMMRIDDAHIYAEHCNIDHRDGFWEKKYYLKLEHFLEIWWAITFEPVQWLYFAHILASWRAFIWYQYCIENFSRKRRYLRKNCNFSMQKNYF